jgi:hypothetical protein
MLAKAGGVIDARLDSSRVLTARCLRDKFIGRGIPLQTVGKK